MYDIIYWLIVLLLLFIGEGEIIRIPFNFAFRADPKTLIVEMNKSRFVLDIIKKYKEIIRIHFYFYLININEYLK